MFKWDIVNRRTRRWQKRPRLVNEDEIIDNGFMVEENDTGVVNSDAEVVNSDNEFRDSDYDNDDSDNYIEDSSSIEDDNSAVDEEGDNESEFEVAVFNRNDNNDVNTNVLNYRTALFYSYMIELGCLGS